MAPHNQPTLARVVPAIGVSAPATGQFSSLEKKLVLQNGEIRRSVGGGWWVSLNVSDFHTGKWTVPGAYSENGDNCQMQLRRRVRTH